MLEGLDISGKRVLDTCGGLGYFAAWCMQGRATQVLSYEINPDVIWLRSLNPWSPEPGGGLTLNQGDIAEHIGRLASASVDAILHDPPRFGPPAAGQRRQQQPVQGLDPGRRGRTAGLHPRAGQTASMTPLRAER